MKKLVLGILLLTICNKLNYSQWFTQSSETTQVLFNVDFINSYFGIAVGDSGTILKTTDGGATWTQQTNVVSVSLNDVEFIDTATATIVGVRDVSISLYATILRTTNGGENWDLQSCGTGTQLWGVSFVNADVGTAVGQYGTILRTTDGGTTWTQQNSGTYDFLYGISFVDENNGTAVGQGTIIHTTDGGITWVNQSSGSNVYDVFFVDINNGTAVGYDGIHRTTNGGEEWILHSLGIEKYFWSVCFNDLSNGWIAGGKYVDTLQSYVGLIMHTSDGGTTWEEQNIGFTSFLYSISFSDKYNGTAVGANGTIVHTTNGGVTSFEETETDEMPTEFLLSQNYPNPFNPSTKISWQVPVGSWQTLKVYDMLGNEIATLVDEYKPAGTYEVEWNASKFPSGVYFYQLRAGSFVETKKMMLMK